MTTSSFGMSVHRGYGKEPREKARLLVSSSSLVVLMFSLVMPTF